MAKIKIVFEETYRGVQYQIIQVGKVFRSKCDIVSDLTFGSLELAREMIRERIENHSN